MKYHDCLSNFVTNYSYIHVRASVAHHSDHTTLVIEPPHDKTNEMACAPSKDSDQPSLIRVFAVRSMGS